ncbi:isoleucine--tRNA ligase [Spiroplasma platyhelix]|uniref:Isoleucine--tRNA ligase n=1 Tax=Spiroplasma platyhelix PALS-1 TaxID=1276218 RepID=A0A846U8D2_9MOLU|nr:isoleucine--tRNA ligase [Spiroplasma platyhelix]MBE4703780.1 Isoleucine--tRNA ligase [Spiroplasma platyhelix PALS-1]NKE38153.1 isoleucine--tRNA ligase [Spiroplasma platyhelix PALS-1]UJB29038.1 isoleucyl-tRNA synthetase [Spiroplasma platyhelix PALS-1]
MNKNYKETLLMPKTNFEMRANLSQKEPAIQSFWNQNQIYQKLITRNNEQKTKQFILHDGPPYANGDLHMGHALNKILKDFLIRYYNANGYYAPYIPGWDTHGLPIEQAVTNSGIDRKTISISEFRQKCLAYASQQVKNQKDQFEKLGLLTDFKQYYVTFDQKYEAQQIRLFAKMIEQEVVYRNLYPVYWSPSSESALAEAEIEYSNKKSPAVFVAFNLIDQANTAVVIWTTTPWTLPANQLLAVNQHFTYVLIKVADKQYYIAKDLLENFLKGTNSSDYQVIKEVQGDDLVGLKAAHPLYQRPTLIVHSDHVNLESGTGVVHIAPGFGVDDFTLGLKHNIQIIVPIDDQGKFTTEVQDDSLVGKFYDDTNKAIVERLKASGNLVGFSWITHSYPHDWRTKKPVIYRATWQWFIAISKLKPEILSAIDKINFFPEWGKKRMTLMTKNRNDWCISRQRAWGVPIPIFYSEKHTAILDSKVIKHVADLFEKYGSNIWYQKTAKELLPENFTHINSPNGNFTKENDIMDVWYDSGVSHLAVIKANGLPWPVDLYFEGNDQFRGWFNSSLITGIIDGKASPYKNALAHGFVNDEKGNKMSKSLGNVLNVKDVCQSYGVDILRLWVASVDFQDDTRIGQEILKQISENYRKIRNLLRFLLGNLFDFDASTIEKQDFNTTFASLAEVDQYILVKLNQLIKDTHSAYQSYQFNNFYYTVLNFITNDLSAFYCDISKDTLYLNAADDKRRKQTQTTMFYLVKTLISLLSPILPHTCEEAFQSLKQKSWDNIETSFMFEPFVEPWEISNEEEILKQWNLFMQLRTEVNQAISQAQVNKIIKNTLESKVVIKLKPEAQALKVIDNQELTKLLIVSEAQWIDDLKADFTSNLADISVTLKQGIKCARCWLIYQNLVTDICQRCTDVLKEGQTGN